jgi:hypothetical protein
MKAQAGHEVYPITAPQLTAWRKAAEPLHAEWEANVKKAGHDPKKVFEDLNAETARLKVAYRSPSSVASKERRRCQSIACTIVPNARMTQGNARHSSHTGNVR